MGVSGRRPTTVGVEMGTTIGMLSWDACGRRTVGVDWGVGLVVGIVVGGGKGGKSCCRRMLSIMAVEGGA